VTSAVIRRKNWVKVWLRQQSSYLVSIKLSVQTPIPQKNEKLEGNTER
jgi:hypothetical protein